MPLYGTDMVDVTTPDGRRLTVPRQLAAGFPGLQPSPPPVSESLLPATPPVLQFTPEDRAQLAAADTGAVTQPSQAPDAGPPPPVRGPVTLPAQAEPGPPNPPAVQRPVTNKQLAAQGNAGAYNAESAAVTERQAALERAATVEADEATKIGEAIEARNAKTDEILAQREAAALANQQALDKRMADYERMAKSIADTKINREADHPILGFIGILLGQVGASMEGRGRENPAWSAFNQAIDRKVAGQMADLDKRRGDLATARDAMGLARQQGMDRLAEFAVRKDAALQQAQQQIDEIKAKSGSARVRANADTARAQLEQERAKLRGDYGQREQVKLHQDALLQEQRASRAESRRQADRTFNEQVRQFNVKESNDLLAAEMAARAKGNEARAKQIAETKKDNETRGVSDIATGERFIQPEGQKLLAEADKIEASAQKMAAAAQAETDPGKKQTLTQRAQSEAQRASEIRGEVAVDHTWRVGNPEIAAKLSTQIASTQTIASTVDRIKALREDKGPKWFVTSEGQAEMQAHGTQLMMAMKTAWQLGVLSAQDVAILEKATGGDPAKLTIGDIINGFGVEGPASRLDAIAQGLEESTRNEMRGKGWKGEYAVKRDTPADLTDEEKESREALKKTTPVEQAQSEKRGIAGRVVDRTGQVLTGQAFDESLAAQRARADIESGSATHPGLYPDQAKAFDLQLRSYTQNLNSKNPTLSAKAKASGDLLVSLASDTSNPDKQSAILNTLRDRAPDLYQQALSRLPESEREAIGQRAQVILAQVPVATLRTTAIAGDQESKTELARRAAAGDRDAIKAISDVIGSKGWGARMGVR